MTDTADQGPLDSGQPESLSGSFLDSLDPALRQEPGLQSFKDVQSLAKSYVEANRLIGRSIRIPTEDAAPEVRQEFYNKLSSVPGVVRVPSEETDTEGWNALYNRLGRPESPSQYKLSIPEGFEVDTHARDQLLEIAHRHGISNQALQALVSFETERQVANVEQYQIQQLQQQERLKQLWGANFDSRADAVKIMGEYLQRKYPQDYADLVNSGVVDNPVILDVLAEFGTLLQESGKSFAPGKVDIGMSAEAAKEQIAEIITNRSHPYRHSNAPGHKEAVDKVNRLYKIAYPD